MKGDPLRCTSVPFLMGRAHGNGRRNNSCLLMSQCRSNVQAHAQQISPIFYAIASCVQYTSDCPAIEPESEPEKSEWEETAEIINERRQEFFTLFKNMTKLAPEQTNSFLRTQLQQKLAAGTAFEVRSHPRSFTRQQAGCMLQCFNPYPNP